LKNKSIITVVLVAGAFLVLFASLYNVWYFRQGSGYMRPGVLETWFFLLFESGAKEGYHRMKVRTTITYETMIVNTRCHFFETTWTGSVIVERYLFVRSLVNMALILLALALIFEVYRYVAKVRSET